MNFQEWFGLKEESEELQGNVAAVELLIEVAQYVKQRDKFADPTPGPKWEKQADIKAGDYIITSATEFLNKSNKEDARYHVRMSDFNFLVASPSHPYDEIIRANGSRKLKGNKYKNFVKEFPKTNVVDVTKAFIDEPGLRPGQSVFLYIKDETPAKLARIEKKLDFIAGNKDLDQRKKEEEERNRENELNALQHLGASPIAINKLQTKNDISDLNAAKAHTNFQTINQPKLAPQAPDDFDARVRKFAKPEVKQDDNDRWNAAFQKSLGKLR